MTRKQALLAAMQILSTDPAYIEISTRLQEIYDDLPLMHWNDKSIHDSVQQFIIDNGRTPTVSDFDHAGLPPHTVIKRRYGINLAEWLEANYPTKRKSFDEKVSPYIRAFIDDYNRIQPKTQQEFELNRSKGVVCYQTIMKYCHVSSWAELISTLHLPDYRISARAKRHIDVVVQIHSDIRKDK